MQYTISGTIQVPGTERVLTVTRLVEENPIGYTYYGPVDPPGLEVLEETFLLDNEPISWEDLIAEIGPRSTMHCLTHVICEEE